MKPATLVNVWHILCEKFSNATDQRYPTKTLPCLTCVPRCFYCVSPCFSYVSDSPFVHYIHLPRIYIEALELHSKSSRSCNSATLQSLQARKKCWRSSTSKFDEVAREFSGDKARRVSCLHSTALGLFRGNSTDSGANRW